MRGDRRLSLGLVSARAAGLRTIGITQTYPASEIAAEADLVIEHLDELTIDRIRHCTLSATHDDRIACALAYSSEHAPLNACKTVRIACAFVSYDTAARPKYLRYASGRDFGRFVKQFTALAHSPDPDPLSPR